ncbi:MAG: peptide chain release factor 3 [bacterium]|nr:peptide chain release factor 3 [bacterium]
MALQDEIKKRRTFGIISHPDAGKTTLTEKLLLFGGAIQVAGAIKSKKASRHATSDFMEIEKQRGISVATSVMGFEYRNTKVNLLDTPGHKDFCEDTYRTLTAVDSVVMVIDSTKGVEAQTEKLLEVCRMRNTPIMTFMNKLDREGMDPIELLDNVEDKLGLAVCPLSWPIGMGKTFQGVYSLYEKSIVLFKAGADKQSKLGEVVRISDLADPVLDERIGQFAADKLREDIELVTGVYPEFNKNDYLAGTITPVFFGSAVNNFGVRELLDCFIDIAPNPRPRDTTEGPVAPDNPKFSGFIFKIHANIDPKHRDRIAFLRICSGTFERNKKYIHVRSGKVYRSNNPTAFMAQAKEVIDTAYPGDIIGLHDTGELRIGDTITDGDKFSFKGIPSFSPEIFKVVVNEDPMKTKQLDKGLLQLCEEGVAQLFIRTDGSRKIIGTVGALQFEVIQYRLEHEYGAKCRFEPLGFVKACWVTSEDSNALDIFIKSRPTQIARDTESRTVYLAETRWSLDREIAEHPEITFHTTSD